MIRIHLSKIRNQSSQPLINKHKNKQIASSTSKLVIVQDFEV